MRRAFRNLLTISALFGFTAAGAQDRLFTYTYQSNVLNSGQKEIEVWTTLRSGRSDFYRKIVHRTEFELGLGKNLQTAFYLNYDYAKAVETTSGTQVLNSGNDFSFSNEWKYKLSDPVANNIGSALYFEYTLGTAETELEAKIILDKQVGRTIHAFNLTGEYELFKEFTSQADRIAVGTNHEFTLELNYAFTYNLRKGFCAGMEFFNANGFSPTSEWENSVLSLGPCLSYNSKNFWVNLTLMPQITNLKGGGLELNDHEKLQTRLIFSYVFYNKNILYGRSSLCIDLRMRDCPVRSNSFGRTEGWNDA